MTLDDALQASPTLPARPLAEYPDLPDVPAYLTGRVGAYLLALEEVCDQAGRKGDLALRSRCLLVALGDSRPIRGP